ncbi:MAG: nicotinamide riboside transporter PnuC, partial [Longimicrobiales bacterium]|nr:nicotinamide riboside transporter PnuC [Longimicrobiales bacterium]
MSAIAGDLLAELRGLAPLEALAVLTAIGYLLLAIRENIWCWLCAAISTSCYVWLFIEARLYMESALNGFYLAMAGYGFWMWRYGAGRERELPVTSWPAALHAVAIAGIALLAAASGTLLARYSDAARPFVDSATTWAAVWTTFLVARKVLENWWYWLVIDVASVFIYWTRGLEAT